MRSASLDARLRLALARGLGPRGTQKLLDHFGRPEAAVSASVSELKALGIAKPADVHRNLAGADLEREHALIEKHGAQLIAFDDERYPTLLKHIHDPPPLLFVRGELKRTDAVALGVVGSRKATAYGREQADRLAASCAQAGLTIVSGGARGIDTAAHRAALRVKGRTIAVLGCGLAVDYPAENAELFHQIASAGGAVVSELPMSAAPDARNFPRRNRIISGLSLGTLVVEAALRSGALITARLAAEDHNREVMALPGRVDSPASAGCHKILREGWATLVTNATDILDALGETGQLLKADYESKPVSSDERPLEVGASDLTEQQLQLFDAIDKDAKPIDHLVRETGLPIHVIQAELTQFQLRGLIDRLGGNQVRRRR